MTPWHIYNRGIRWEGGGFRANDIVNGALEVACAVMLMLPLPQRVQAGTLLVLHNVIIEYD